MGEQATSPRSPKTQSITLGIVGARGYTAQELIRLLVHHPQFQLSFVCSRALAGEAVSDHYPEWSGRLRFCHWSPEQVALAAVDAVILALPNGQSAPYVHAIQSRCAQTVILDLSADYRFDPQWYYGLPELTRSQYHGQRYISNPGCYATAMQLGIAPLRTQLADRPQCFGVSGYSGAGTMPSEKNHPSALHDNLIPYALVDHLHQREVSAHLGIAVDFMPHVAPHFRGLMVTINLRLHQAMTQDALRQHYRRYYAQDPLVCVIDDIPWVNQIAQTHGVQVGGLVTDATGCRAVLVVTLDNLLKGAATQAIQNLNRAFHMPELTAIPTLPASIRPAQVSCAPHPHLKS